MATMFPNGVPMPQPKPPIPQPTPAATNVASDLRTGWQQFLADPANRAGLLQFGISMLGAPQGNTLGQNLGNALGEGFAARGAAQEQQVAQDAATVKDRRAQEMHDATLDLRRAQAVKARRAPQGRASSSTSGMPTQKDYAKEWIKYVKDARANEDERTIPELRQDFDQIWGAATTPAGTPAAAPSGAGAQLNISAMTMAELAALDAKSLTPEQLAAASARYQALQKAK